jgi:DNA-binding NarL/FixJ family response regulator
VTDPRAAGPQASGSADRSPLITALRRALDICNALGAVATAWIIRQTMRSLGIRSVPAGQRAATRENPLGLTQREQEVLELLCEGRTNASIATKLVISPKTVDHHVSSILARLGVSKRPEVAAAKLQRTPPPSAAGKDYRERR